MLKGNSKLTVSLNQSARAPIRGEDVRNGGGHMGMRVHTGGAFAKEPILTGRDWYRAAQHHLLRSGKPFRWDLASKYR